MQPHPETRLKLPLLRFVVAQLRLLASDGSKGVALASFVSQCRDFSGTQAVALAVILRARVEAKPNAVM
jgi:hypothetical protein